MNKCWSTMLDKFASNDPANDNDDKTDLNVAWIEKNSTDSSIAAKKVWLIADWTNSKGDLNFPNMMQMLPLPFDLHLMLLSIAHRLMETFVSNLIIVEIWR